VLRDMDRTATDAARIPEYVSAAGRIGQACDAEARSMPASFVEDWRTQSFLVRSPVRDLPRPSQANQLRALSIHSRRMERLLAFYDAMFENPPAAGARE